MGTAHNKILLLVFLLLSPTLARATNWFVDPAATGSNNGTSWTNAWQTISAFNAGCNSVQPGDTVFWSGGSSSQTYNTSSVSVTLCKGGTAGNPITFIAWSSDSGHNGQVIFDSMGTRNPNVYQGQSYVNFTGNTGGGACSPTNACKLTFGDCDQTGNYYCVDMDGSGFAGQITANHASYFELKKAGTGWHQNYINGSEVDHFYVHDISSDGGLEFNGSLGQYSGDMSLYNLYGLGVLVHHGFVQVNNNQGNDGDGPDGIAGTHGISVYNNVIWGAAGVCYSHNNNGLTCAQDPNGSQHQDGVQMGGEFYQVYNNTFYCLANSDIESGSDDTVTGFLRAWNNNFTQCSQQVNSHQIELQMGLNTVTRMTDVRVMNNNFVDTYGGPGSLRIITVGGTQTADNIQFTNNIVYNGNPFDIEPFTCGTGILIDANNINAGASGSTTGLCHGATYAGDTNRTTGAPTFVVYSPFAPSTNNLRITSGSAPDIGNGANLSIYFTTDADGNARAASPTAWDRGPYNSGTAPPSPQITTTSIPNGTVGTAYSSTTMAASGGFSPYTWSSTGMATGLSISSGGVITGTPTVAGSYTENITVTDAHSVTATKPFTVVISPNVTTPGGTINQGGTQQGILSSQNGATFLKQYQSTPVPAIGNWQGLYGTDGYSIPAFGQNIPSYVAFTPTASIYTWAASSADPRALQIGSPRFASCWYSPTSFTFDLNFKDGKTHEFSLYAVDWDAFGGGRVETINVNDATTGALLDSRTISGFQDGLYLSYQCSGHVKFTVVNKNAPANAVISGVFFG